mgnify:CR=1 FL=1
MAWCDVLAMCAAEEYVVGVPVVEVLVVEVLVVGALAVEEIVAEEAAGFVVATIASNAAAGAVAAVVGCVIAEVDFGLVEYAAVEDGFVAVVSFAVGNLAGCSDEIVVVVVGN